MTVCLYWAYTLYALQIADTITELKIGQGTSILIFANIASGLPQSFGAALQQAATKDSSNLAVYAIAFFLTTLGIVYVQEAERKIPMNYASRYRNSALASQSYLPFKVSHGRKRKEKQKTLRHWTLYTEKLNVYLSLPCQGMIMCPLS